MRIVHVVDSMEVGGAEILVSQLCRAQRNGGHEPIVYAVAALGALGEQMQKDGFTVKPNVGRHLADSVRGFYRLFKESRPDVVHIHNPTPTIYAAMAARMAGVPSIISTRHSLVARPRNMTVEFKYACAAVFCDWVVGICEATTENLREIHTVARKKIIRVYNGAARVERAPESEWPEKSGFTLVFVGRLEPVKNHAFLLKGFAQAIASRPELRLWMVGDGSERSNLERLASDLGLSGSIKFWGQQLDVAPFLSAADAFIMSSRSEGLPMSLLQAFSLGLPAIVTDVGGMAEVVRQAQAGFTVALDDAASMSEAILSVARNDTERVRFSKNAAKAFNTLFSLQTMADAYMALYQKSPRLRRGA